MKREDLKCLATMTAARRSSILQSREIRNILHNGLHYSRNGSRCGDVRSEQPFADFPSLFVGTLHVEERAVLVEFHSSRHLGGPSYIYVVQFQYALSEPCIRFVQYSPRVHDFVPLFVSLPPMFPILRLAAVEPFA